MGVLRGIFGGLQATANFDTFCRKWNHSSAGREDLARLRHKRLVVADEGERGASLDEETIKRITGGERISARDLYRATVEYEPRFKIVLVTNNCQHIQESGDAIWRRMMVAPFEQYIKEGQRDLYLGERLAAEGPGILRWLVEGAVKWYADGLKIPEAMKEVLARYRSIMDTLEEFITDTCDLLADGSELRGNLYQAYLTFCKAEGHKPLGGKNFTLELEKKGFKRYKSDNVRGFHGLKLKIGYNYRLDKGL